MKKHLKKNSKREISFLRKKIKEKKERLIRAGKDHKRDIEIKNSIFRINMIKKIFKNKKNESDDENEDNNKKNDKENEKENIKNYFEYFKSKCDYKKRARSASTTVDEKINEILKIKKTKLEEFEEKFYNLEISP